MMIESRLEPALIEDLAGLLGDRLSTAQIVREHHGKDTSFHQLCPPQAVVFPEDEDEVCRIVQSCVLHGTPIIPYGAGTSTEGHISALHGGVAVDMSRMNRILRVSASDLDVTVEAGVTRKQLNNHLRDCGLFFPIDPGADATIGGMAATRASGTNAVRYGTMKENVLSLSVVLPNGERIRTARRARKSAAGYDLTSLFVGSAGTLGIITDITLRLHGIPEAIAAGVCGFPSLESAVATAIALIQGGVPVARIELMDELSMRALNGYSKLDLPVAPTLIFELHGTGASVAEQSELVATMARDQGGGTIDWQTRQEERNRLWQARHDIYFALLAQRPGAEGWPTDVCVPISRLADCIGETLSDLRSCSLPVAILGHVGDGNFHVLFAVDPAKQEEIAATKVLNDRMIRRAIGFDGTCTGEHGIGYGKLAYMELEHAGAVGVMRALKQALDPLDLFNPGKVVPNIGKHRTLTRNIAL
jgi:D-lactate dehydrogenase (cytochrome)